VHRLNPFTDEGDAELVEWMPSDMLAEAARLSGAGTMLVRKSRLQAGLS
jgi:hypothetical protein